MASSFLEKKAKQQAEKLEKQYGSTAYGGTTWLNEQLTGKKKKKKKEDEDIAPVATTTKKEDKGLDFFQKGAFEDGYQLGDITKTILGTTGDLGVGIVKGASKLVGGVVDAGYYATAGIADAFGGDEFADKVRLKARENTIDNAFKGVDNYLNQYSVLGKTSDAVAEGIGQVGSIILTGGIAGAAGLGAAGVTAVTTGAMGVSSLGAGMSEAYESGATDEEAATYGLIKGVVDAGSELIFGGLGKTVKALGISKGLSNLDDVFAQKLSSKITNHVAKNFVQYGVKASAEGVEEVLAGLGSAVGKKLTYMSDKELKALVEDENLLEQFVVGAVTSGISQSGIVPGMRGGSLVEANQTGRDFISGMSENEQKVIDKVVEQRIAEEEKKGKLDNKRKNAIYDEVVRDMERGYISTDTIEEVLGGESYNTYKRTVDYEDSLQNEFTELNRMKQADMTGEQQDRRMELKQQLEDIKQNSKRELYKTNLSENVFRSIQNDRLTESYNERSRRGQAFEADLTKYDTKQQETIKKAVESGILNNTNRTHEFVDMIAKITADKGVLFDFTNNERLKESGFAVDGKAVNGYVTKDGVTLNIDSAKSLNSVVGHEITHVLEGTEVYDVLKQAVSEYAKTKGDYQGRYDSLSKLYEGVEGADVDAELTADLVGDYLFTDADFVRNLSVQHRNVFQKIYDEIKYLCKVATAGSKEARELEKVKRAFEKAYQESGKQQSDDADTKYSLVEDQETIDFLENQDYIVTYKAMQVIDGKLYPPMSAETKVEEEYTDKKGNKKTKTVRKLKQPSELGRWQKSDENLALAEQRYDPKKGYSSFDLLKGNGKTIQAAYNPYEHTSNIVLNDQFEEAYNRPNLVTVEYHIPVSELTSGYKAEYAKDAVGQHSWKSGPVAKDLKDPRQVYLTRWSKPVRILPDSEVAAKYKEILDGTGLSVPFNVVTPSLLSELEKAGVAINYDGSPMYQSIQRRAAEKNAKYSLSDSDSKYADAFYSHMGKVIDDVKQEKLGAASVIPMLKGKGVKAEEIKWSGIEQFLDGKKSVTKQELQEFARNSQLQIEEETLDNKEIPYTEEQNAKIAEYTEKHRAIMDNLATEWERIVGSEFPLDRAANINSDDIDRQIKEAAATSANDTPEGLRHKELQGKIRAMIEANDYFGYDRMGQPYRSIVWNPESFISNYEMSDEDADLIREFAESKRTMDEIRARAAISEQDVHKLKSIANNAAAYYRKITDVKSEHYAENAKRMSKWGQYKLDGGENYREYLFKMPGSDYSNQAMTGHWGNERHGVLAHARVQDFDTPNGKMLFIEEIQSDWHNEGAKQGYADEESKGFTELTLGEYEMQSNGVPIAEVTDAYDNIYAYVMKVQGKYVVDFGNGHRFDSFLEEADAMSALKAQAQYDVGTPDAPFRKNYHEFVLKNLLRKAAEDGYDSIGWTTADLQSERWSDEFAEGYRIEYDQDIPKFLSKYGKKWGAQVGKTKLNQGNREVHQDRVEQLRMNIANWRRELSLAETESEREFIQNQIEYERSELNEIIDGGTEVWTMPITEAMKQSVLYEGQPQYSLSKEGEQVAPVGKYNVYGKDIALETAPVPNTDSNTQPVSNTDSNTVNALDSDMFPDDLAPMADDPERFDSLTDADMPPEMDAPYTETGEVTVDDPFEERDWYKVGNRKVNAYMYENPEVKPFFQEEAAMLLAELNDTIKGEKWYNDDLYYQTNGEQGFGGTKRLTSDSIATMLDGWGMSYADIEKGLNAILEDNGAENIAAAKKIEFMLNDRLLNGYKDFYSRSMTPPNEEYVKLLNEKQITEYSTEAFDAFMANADSYAPPVEDIAPVAKPVQRSTYQAAPVEKYEAIRPKREKQPRMARATPAEQARAEILVDEPKVEQKKKNGLWNWAKVNLLDPGTVFETLSLKSGNPELQAKFSSIKRAESRAQRHMENGNGMTSSLKSIREGVEKTGKTKQFYEYLYHLHNKDRMSLENRYSDVENKPVFGSSITADISALEVAELEKRNPEFKRLAQEVYNYMGNLREMLVEGGVISRETAQLWQEMYPHYVPIRREGHDGVNINVPLDSRKTGINAPIKRATGGNSNILPLFDTMAQRTIQTYKAIAKNRFGVELKNTIGHTIESEAAGVDEVIDSIDTHEELLQAGKNGMSPTFTVFENGEKVTFEITDEMYDAMKPKSGAATLNSKVLNKVNDVRRGLITEYNPVFAVTNPIKDIQDVLINSKHPARTYANMPKAIGELLSNGHWYQEYLDNGGEQNTYFEGETNTFVKEKSALRKVVGFPLDKLSQVNNFIEKVPRLAEYIASRKAGRSIDVSMLDAARVTTDFSAGGHITKMMNRNGFTFLNASVQGAVQQVRNFREAKYNGLKGWAQLAGKTVAAGLPAMLLNHLLWDDDEEYEELSDYVKQNYYIVGKFDDGKFVRIPKGRTVAVIQNAIEQMENLITGNDEADLGAFAELVISNLAPSNPLDNNIIAPIAQAWRNETWYGEDLVPTRLQDLPAAEQYDESTDSISRWLGEKANISPYKLNYLLDQYSGGVGDTFLPMLTPEAERGDDTLLGNLIAPWKDKFTTDAVMNNQNVSDFYTKKDELTVNANAAEATEEDVLMSKYLNSVNAEMSKLYAEKRKIQNSDLPDAEKYAAVRDVQKQIVELSKEGLNTYGDISFEDDYREGGEYARVNDRLYKLNDEGEWSKLSDDQVTKYEVTKAAGNSSYATDGTNHYRWYVPGEDADKDTKPGWRKVTDKELEKQQEVTKGLGISPETYWSNREEYSYAYEHPENYAVAKAVGGYEAYRNYSSELYDIKADKDSSGKSISGSRKEKVLDYVNGLDIEYGEKLILFKNEYNADDEYNYEIIDYLNSREDISFEEMATILKKIGFTVSADGDISW